MEKNRFEFHLEESLWPLELANYLEQTIPDLFNASKDIAVVLTNDKEIRFLNKTWRGKDKPTNVLSFIEEPGGPGGTVYLSYETIQVESEQQLKSLRNHTTHLLIHGILHLMGHTHDNTEGAGDTKIMQDQEIALLKKLGIENPYS